MLPRHGLVICLLVGSFGLLRGQNVPTKELQAESDDYMREELGVNDITAPSIAKVLSDLSVFQPVPLDIIASFPRDAVFDNRLQTSLHLGALVADGFMLTLAQRSQDIREIGRSMLREAQALGVGERMTKRSKSLLDLSDKGDWQGLREELVKTQSDVEKSMLDLRDEQMAHMISLGGWLRGYQLAANVCARNYQVDKASILARYDIIDYYVDRLNTLHPRLKKTNFVSTLTAKLKDLRDLAATTRDRPPTQAEVKQMRDLANAMEAIAVGPVDDDGQIVHSPPAK